MTLLRVNMRLLVRPVGLQRPRTVGLLGFVRGIAQGNPRRATEGASGDLTPSAAAKSDSRLQVGVGSSTNYPAGSSTNNPVGSPDPRSGANAGSTITSAGALAGLSPKDLLLTQASFFERFRIRGKWFLSRNPTRPLGVDEYSAVFSWVLVGHVVWFAFYTTTFVSLLLYGFSILVNNDEYTTKLASSILSQGLNLDISFDGSAVPLWKNGMLSFSNVAVSSREGNDMALRATIETVRVLLSFGKWSRGEGLIDLLEVYGLRGTIQRAGEETDAPALNDLFALRYHLSSLVINDSYITLGYTTPLELSIYNCTLSQLRSEWLLLDVFNADNISGVINGSMFTMHKRQSSAKASAFITDVPQDASPWKKITRLRIDSVDLSAFERFNWIRKGEAELTCDIMLPNEEPAANQFYEFLHQIQLSLPKLAPYGDVDFVTTRNETLASPLVLDPGSAPTPYVVLDVKLQLRDGVKTRTPLELPLNAATGEPFVSRRDLRRIINYLNLPRADHDSEYDSQALPTTVAADADAEAAEHLAFLFRVIAKHDVLHHQASLRSAGLLDLVVQEAYNEVVRTADESNIETLQFKIDAEKNYNYWSHSVFGSLLLVGLGFLN